MYVHVHITHAAQCSSNGLKKVVFTLLLKVIDLRARERGTILLRHNGVKTGIWNLS